MLAAWQARSGEFYSPRGKLGMERIGEWNGLAHGRERKRKRKLVGGERELIKRRRRAFAEKGEKHSKRKKSKRSFGKIEEKESIFG